MAESPSHHQTPSPPTEPQSAPAPDPVQQYWCYHCDKRVSVETLADLPDVVCYECKNGFVEAIAHSAAASTALPLPSDLVDDPSFSSQFLQVLRLIAQAARDDDAPPPPPSEHADPSDDDYLRIELDGWDNNNDEDDDDDEDNGVVVRNETDDDEEEGEENDRRDERDENEEDTRRQRRDVLRLRLRDLAARAANRRNRILDWAEILMGLEDHSIELRLHAPEMDDYVGNPEDYLDAAGYEALLQNLAESDGNGRRGAPPASKSAVLGLKKLEIVSEDDCVVCAICKDSVNVGEKAKEMPCGHGYHEECIVPWLGSRNSCPVCRFELETDDAEYEQERKKRGMGMGKAAGIGPSTSSHG
ncbi:hypothetical protein C3L33_11159, partial [Rhododendron williamsianum]